jgi:hypothetical protein
MEGKDSASALSMRNDNPESMARSVFNDYICFNKSALLHVSLLQHFCRLIIQLPSVIMCGTGPTVLVLRPDSCITFA